MIYNKEKTKLKERDVLQNIIAQNLRSWRQNTFANLAYKCKNDYKCLPHRHEVIASNETICRKGRSTWSNRKRTTA